MIEIRKYLASRCFSKICFPCQTYFHSSSSVLNVNERSKETKTAGIIVIGDEILKGQVQDRNSHFVSKIFYDMGIRVKRISVVGDCKDEISKEVKHFSSMFTFVITTGGIGPTHDDVTFEAIAKAFEVPIEPHPTIVKICSKFFNTNDLDSPAMKLAHIPKSATLTFGYDREKKQTSNYPCVSVKNVYIFPGVPHLMQRSFTAVCDQLFGGGKTKFYLKELYLSHDESKIANHLNKVVTEFPQVVFGSYPDYLHMYYKVRLTVESQEETVTLMAYERLRVTLPSNSIVDYDTNPLDMAYDKLLNLVKRQKISYLQNSIEIIDTFCKNSKPREVWLYFDGGIESTVVLHLYYACLNKANAGPKISALCVHDTDSSTDLENYMKDAAKMYNVSVDVQQEPPTTAIKHCISKHPEIRLFIIGSSEVAIEWNASLGSSSESSEVKILQPIDKWSKAEAWDFIRTLCLSYYIPST